MPLGMGAAAGRSNAPVAPRVRAETNAAWAGFTPPTMECGCTPCRRRSPYKSTLKNPKGWKTCHNCRRCEWKRWLLRYRPADCR